MRHTERAAPSRPHAHAHRAVPVVFAGFLLILAAHGAGLTPAWTFSLVTFAGVICGVIGLTVHRHRVVWPWMLFVGSGVLWTIAALVREATGATGDLSADRSLLPDAFALPGYLLFGTALWGLLRARIGPSERDVMLDGLMLMTGSALIVHVFLVTPAVGDDGIWPMARLAIIVYPVMSTAMLLVASRLAFSGDTRAPAFGLVVLGTFSLLVGDVAFAAGELGLVDLPDHLLEVPYLLVPAALGTALLDPSARRIANAASRTDDVMKKSRHLMVSIALFAPVAVLLLERPSGTELFSVALCVILAVLAVVRIVLAMQAQAESKELLAYQATHDELTGLPGRIIATQLIDELLQRDDQPVAVMFVDLDHFKLVNDSMGHAAGDELLALVADRLRGAMPDDVVVCRVSGDEFLVVAPGRSPGEAGSLGERIRSVMSERFVLRNGVDVFAAASAGIAVGRRRDGTDASTLIREADAAMYRSKELGRNQTTMFDIAMREEIEYRVSLERALREAIPSGGLSVAYQPIVAWPSQTVVGLEALARWKRDGHDIPPPAFIKVAEDSGLIIPLGAFVLDEALRQVAWLRQNIGGCEELYMSVNLSPMQLQSGEIVDVIAEALDRHGLPGRALYLEITEGVMMSDPVAAVSAMSAIGALGVRLALDDFGTGFSSLSYLKRFPIDVVKIDRSFVSGLGAGDADESVVKAIVSMTEALDLVTIAEGVETKEQAQRLAALGCDRMQGFLFSRAVPIIELPDVLARLSDRHVARPRRRRCDAGYDRIGAGRSATYQV